MTVVEIVMLTAVLLAFGLLVAMLIISQGNVHRWQKVAATWQSNARKWQETSEKWQATAEKWKKLAENRQQ